MLSVVVGRRRPLGAGAEAARSGVRLRTVRCHRDHCSLENGSLQRVLISRESAGAGREAAGVLAATMVMRCLAACAGEGSSTSQRCSGAAVKTRGEQGRGCVGGALSGRRQERARAEDSLRSAGGFVLWVKHFQGSGRRRLFAGKGTWTGRQS